MLAVPAVGLGSLQSPLEPALWLCHWLGAARANHVQAAGFDAHYQCQDGEEAGYQPLQLA